MNATTENKGLDWFSEAAMAAGRGSDVMLGDFTANRPTLPELQASGERLTYMSLVLLKARSALPMDAWPGFYVGVAAMHYCNVQTAQLITIREELLPSARKGFDMALTLYVGYARKAQFGCVPFVPFAGDADFGAEAKTILGMPAGKSKPKAKAVPFRLATARKIVKPAAPAAGPAEAAADFLKGFGQPQPQPQPQPTPTADKPTLAAAASLKKDVALVSKAPSAETGLPPAEPLVPMTTGPAPVESPKEMEAPKTFVPQTFVDTVSTEEGTPQKDVQVEPGKLAGYLATSGMQGATEAQRVSLMADIATTPDVRQGAVLAVKEEAKKKDEGFFKKLLKFFGLA